MVAMSSEETSKPAGRRWRGIVVIGGLILAVLITAVGGALLFRENLAQIVVRDRLTALGFEEPRFQIEEFTTDAFSITKFSTGSALSFGRLTIGYSVDGLLEGRISHIDVIGLQADLSQPGPWTDFQTKELSGKDTPVNPASLPTINIQQAQLRIPALNGIITVKANATMEPDPDGKLVVSATASADGPPGKIDMGYEGSVRIGGDGAIEAAGRFQSRANELSSGKSKIKSLKIDVPLAISTARDSVTVRIEKGARLDAKRFDLDVERGTGPVSLSLDGQLTSTSVTDGWFDAATNIILDAGAIRAGGLAIEKFTGALPLQINTAAGTVKIALGVGTRLAFDKAQLGKETPTTALATGLSGNIALTWPTKKSAAKPPITVSHNLSVTPSPFTLAGEPALAATLGKILTRGTLAANGSYSGRIAMDTGQFTLGDHSVAMTGLKTRLTTRANFTGPRARITVESVRDLSAATVAGAPVSGTYDLDADIRQTDDGLTYKIGVGGLGIRKLAAITGLHRLDNRTGHADVSVPDLTLGAGGIEPSAVIPALGTLRNVVGNIGARARLSWDAETIGGQATLRLDGIGGRLESGGVEGLSGTLVFDNIWPPSTSSGQELRIRKIDAGAILTESSIRFTLLPSGILKISRAQANLADGKLIVVVPAINPTAQTAEATVTFQGVELAQILDLVDLGDLKATGQIHGFVPVRVTGGKIAIDAGALASLGGGKLQFKSERAQQILQSGGDQVGLMLKALEDFTYERLGVDIDKTLAGNARVRLRTLGHNPAVLNGRKFQINVNLETNLDRVLDAALEWYRLSGRALRDIVRPRSRKGTQ